jgi:hypothetical protein
VETGRLLPRQANRQRRFEGARSIVCTLSYFAFRSTVARRRGENSCTQVQNWSRAVMSDEIARNLHQLRRTGVVQVF